MIKILAATVLVGAKVFTGEGPPLEEASVVIIQNRIEAVGANVSHPAGAEVIDVSQLSGDTVKFGATVVLADEDTDAESTYQLVGTDESDIKQGLLSITSPLARALIGKAAGDSVDVDTPRGVKSYEIVKLAWK